MFLGSYTFDGDPDELTAAYDRLMAGFPQDQILFQSCIRTADGITVYDACPDQPTFAAFSSDASVLGAMSAAGLPEPVVAQLGEVHHTHVAPKVLA